jgi:hypothetical protein
MYLSNKELSKAIQNDLKAAGVPRAAYSIRVQDCGYSVSVRINIRDLAILPADVKRIALHYQEYDRDERTGEILEGGNTYVFVQYDFETLQAAQEKFLPQAVTIRGKGYQEIMQHKNGNRLVYLDTYDGEGFLYVKVPGQENIPTMERFYCRSSNTIAEGLAIFTATGRLN